MKRGASFLLMLVLCSAAMAKEGSEATNKSPGLQVGEKAPDFTLLDQDNQKVQMSALLKNGPVAIVFHRSAQW